ncbi:MAG: NAD(P)-binding domain-containing protein, partial [Pseudomonadota bacterium]
MARTAFLGLGVMGYPMAGHLARAVFSAHAELWRTSCHRALRDLAAAAAVHPNVCRARAAARRRQVQCGAAWPR